MTSRSSMHVIVAVTTIATALSLPLLSAQPAQALDRGHGPGGRGGGHFAGRGGYHGGVRHGWGGYRGGGYYGNGYYGGGGYWGGGGYYNYAPPVVYGGAYDPGYYYDAPPVVYGPGAGFSISTPGFSLGFGIP